VRTKQIHEDEDGPEHYAIHEHDDGRKNTSPEDDAMTQFMRTDQKYNL
jgi:hypothetical protein